jgi:hypothetical protein
MWPQQWGRFFPQRSSQHKGQGSERSPAIVWPGPPPSAGTSGPAALPDSALEEPPHKVRQQCEQQQHKHPANPYQEVQGHLRRVDFFLVHTPNASTPAAVRYDHRLASQRLLDRRLWLRPKNVALTATRFWSQLRGAIVLEHLHSSTTGFPAPAPLRYTACTYDQNLSLRSILGCRNFVG